MAVRSGLAAQLGFAEEVTYGTRVVPTRFLEFAEESIEVDIKRVEAFGLRASAGASSGTVQRSDRWESGTQEIGGKVTFKKTAGILYKGFSMLVKHGMGAAPTITTPGGGTNTRLHTFADFGDPFGLGLTTQIGTPDVGGTVRVREFTGCKVKGFSITQDRDDWAALELDIAAQAMSTSQSLASASYTTTVGGFHWAQLAVTIGGSSVNCLGFELNVDTSLADDRFYSGTTTIAEPIQNGRRRVTGKIELEFSDLTAWNRYLNGTTAAIVATWTGATIEAALSYYLKTTINTARFDKVDGPNVKGPEIITVSLPFEGLYDGTNPALAVEYQTTDTVV